MNFILFDQKKRSPSNIWVSHSIPEFVILPRVLRRSSLGYAVTAIMSQRILSGFSFMLVVRALPWVVKRDDLMRSEI
jgi:hypothetical protein